MQSRVRIGELETAVAQNALTGAFENELSARGRGRIVASGRRPRRSERQLVSLQRRKLRGDEVVGAIRHVDTDATIGERAVPAHLGDRDVTVPVRNVLAVAGGRDAVDALQSVRWRYDLRTVQTIEIE